MNDDDAAPMVEHGPRVEPDAPLLDLPDALVNDRGRTAAARALGVSYATMLNCYQSRRVTRRMRQALVELRDSQDAGGEAGADAEDGVEVVGGDGAADGEAATLVGRVAALEGVGGRVGGAQAVDAGDVPGDVQGNARGRDWRPPRRSPGMPAAGAVTLEEQPDEAHAFGPAAPLVAEGRLIRTMMVDDLAGSRVDRATAAVRRWELEAEMLRDFHLTMPPETEPVDDTRGRDHIHRREYALAEAMRELGRANRLRMLRLVVTVGLWRK